MEPVTHYAESGEASIAYQVIGKGPLDLVYVSGWISNIELMWEDRRTRAWLDRLATFLCLLAFDKRGTGLSDRVPDDRLPDLETRMDDVWAAWLRPAPSAPSFLVIPRAAPWPRCLPRPIRPGLQGRCSSAPMSGVLGHPITPGG